MAAQDEPVEDNKNTTDDWKRAVDLLTGYVLPDRSTVFDTLKGNDGIPLMHVRVDDLGGPSYENGFLTEAGWQTRNTDFTIPFYSPSNHATENLEGRELDSYRAHITFLAQGGDEVFSGDDVIKDYAKTSDNLTDKGGYNWEGEKLGWNTNALVRYVYGSRAALLSLTTPPHYSTHGFVDRGYAVTDPDYVDLLSLTEAVKAFDRVFRFFEESSLTVDKWDTENIGEGSDSWDGTSAAIFKELIHKLARNYEGYADQLAAQGDEGSAVTIDGVPAVSAPARVIAEIQQVLFAEANNLVRTWDAWRISSNPQRFLFDILQDAYSRMFDHHYRPIDIGDWPANTVTAEAGFKNTIIIGADPLDDQSSPREVGPPHDMATWRHIGEEAVRRWNEAAHNWLAVAGSEAIAAVTNAFNAAIKAFDTDITDRDKRPLSEISAQAESDAEKRKAEEEAAAAKAEADKEKADAEAEQAQQKADYEKDKAEAEAEQEQAKAEADQEKAQAKAEQEQEKAQAKAEQEQAKAEADQEKAQAKAEQEQEKAQAKAEQEQAKAEADQAAAEQQAFIVAQNQQAKDEAAKERERARAEQEAAQAEVDAEQAAAEAEAEAEEAAARAEYEQEKADAEAEQEQQKAEYEKDKAEAEAEQEQARAEAEAEQEANRQDQAEAQASAEAAQEQARRDATQDRHQARLDALNAQEAAQRDYEQRQAEARAERDAAVDEVNRREQQARQEYQQEQAAAREDRDQARAEAEADRAEARAEYDRQVAAGAEESEARREYDQRIEEIDAAEREALERADAAEAAARDDYDQARADAQGDRDQARADAERAREDAKADYDERMGDIHAEYDRLSAGNKDIDELIRQRIADLPQPPGPPVSDSGGSPGSAYSSAFGDNLYNQDDLASALGRPQGSDAAAASAGGTGTGTGSPGMYPPMMRGMGGDAGGNSGERTRTVIEPGVARPGRAAAAGAGEEEHRVAPRGTTQTSSGMPFMPPMGGGGMGGAGDQQQTESGDRERTTWLAEDEDVWGTDEGGAPQALGR